MSTPLIPCTVQLLTRNGGDALKICLQTLTEFAEVIVQDGYSTDGSREMAATFPNVRILDQDKQFLDAAGRITHFSNMRNKSIRAARFDWVLVVDADERVEQVMTDEVRGIVEVDMPGVYQAFRRFIVDGEKVMHCAGYPALQIRLFHRSQVEGYEKPIHERLALKPGVIMQMLHTELPVPLPPAASLQAKYDRYLRMEVKRTGVISWSRWARWFLLRSLRTMVGLTLRIAIIWLTPRTGKRMPLAYEFQAVTHAWRLIWACCPPLAARYLAKEVTASHTSAH